MSSNTRRDIRISIAGNVDAGKSSLLGVLTGGQLDDGRGLSRQFVFRFAHEMESGRTSSITHQSLGYKLVESIDESKTTTTTNGVQLYEPVFNPCAVSSKAAAKDKGCAKMVAEAEHFIDFIDNAGHARYSKSTVRGLTVVLPDYAMLIINASDGVTRGSVTGKDKFEEVNMTKEHWAVICALQIPLIIILTKMDLVPADMYEKNKTILHKYMKAAKRKPMHINNNQDVEELFKIDALLNTYSPIVSISAKSGHNIALLHHLLSNLKPVPLADWTNFMDSTLAETDEKKHTSTAVFSIDDDFEVENTGLVVSGVVTNGQIKAKNVMWLGPLAGADKDYPMVRPVQKLEFPYHFIPVVLKSIEKHRTLYEDWVGKGSNCAIAIRPENRKYDLKRAQIHPGMFLFDHSIVPTATTVFEAKVHILHHATMIKVGYQAVIFIGMSTQTVSVLDIKDEKGEESLPLLHTGDKARVVFQFNARAESLHEEMPFVFRESHTKGTGVVLKSEFTIDELEKILKTYRVSKQVRAMLQRDQKARS